jgi:hypothetical protein
VRNTQEEDSKLTTYEVHYQKGEEYGEELVEAEYPQQAQQKFLIDRADREIVVLCVLRHNLAK